MSDDAERGEDESGYEHVRIDELPDAPNPTRHKKEVDEAVGATAFGLNVYVAAPGEQVPWGRHRHPDHEELFYVVAGELAVGTPEGTYRVGAGEAFFVPPDHPNRARAVGDEQARVVAVGAPKDADTSIIGEECPACGDVTDRDYEPIEDGEVYVLTCAACGAETDRLHAGPT